MEVDLKGSKARPKILGDMPKLVRDVVECATIQVVRLYSHIQGMNVQPVLWSTELNNRQVYLLDARQFRDSHYAFL